jgi:hypothetical protein
MSSEQVIHGVRPLESTPHDHGDKQALLVNDDTRELLMRWQESTPIAASAATAATIEPPHEPVPSKAPSASKHPEL